MKLFSCKITGHTLKEISKESLYMKEYVCSKCKQKYTTNGYGKIVKLTKYWKDNNEYFAAFLENKPTITL